MTPPSAPTMSAACFVHACLCAKKPQLEDKNALKRRIDEAAKYVPLENLC
jgi:hypothetical protein